MEFVETTVFTRQIQELLSTDQYKSLQLQLLINPEAGALIKKSGGLRKLRWGGSGRGKRGGIRVIYYFMTAAGNIFLLFAYPKGRKDDLSDKELQLLKSVVRQELEGQ